MNKIIFGAIVGSALWSDAGAALTTSSVRTALEGRRCISIVEEMVTGATTLRCPGVSGYYVQVLHDDERHSINIETPSKKILPLNFWDVVTPGVSSLGPSVEWLTARQAERIVPVGLIVRLNSLDQTDLQSPRRISFLVIVQIRAERACVVAKLDASLQSAIGQARQIAGGNSRACLANDA